MRAILILIFCASAFAQVTTFRTYTTDPVTGRVIERGMAAADGITVIVSCPPTGPCRISSLGMSSAQVDLRLMPIKTSITTIQTALTKAQASAYDAVTKATEATVSTAELSAKLTAISAQLTTLQAEVDALKAQPGGGGTVVSSRKYLEPLAYDETAGGWRLPAGARNVVVKANGLEYRPDVDYTVAADVLQPVAGGGLKADYAVWIGYDPS